MWMCPRCLCGLPRTAADRAVQAIANRIDTRGDGFPLLFNQGTYDYSLVIIPFQEPLSHGRLFAEADFLHMPVECPEDSCHRGDRRRISNLQYAGGVRQHVFHAILLHGLN